MLQLASDEDSYAIDLRFVTKSQLKELISLLENPYYKKVGQNIKFDYQMLKKHYNVTLTNIADTMIIEQLLYIGRNFGFSLEKLAKRYLGVSYSSTNQLDLFSPVLSNKISKETRKQFKLIGNKPFTDDQVIYGLMDVEFTLQIYSRQLSKIAEEGIARAVTFECAFIPVLAEIELGGFYLEKGEWMRLYESNLKKLNDARARLVRMIKKEKKLEFKTFQKSLFEEEEIDINLNSSRQVVELCLALGIPTKVIDKKKTRESDFDIWKDSVEEKHLRKYIKEFPIIAAYLEYKKLEKAVTTYGIKFAETHINPVTNRVQSNYRQLVNSSRLASKEPNLQNIPSEEKMVGFRRCFQPGNQDWTLVVADYSQQESRILAELANEDTLIEFFNTGDGDLHSYTARLMFKVPVDKHTNANLRQLAKILNFG